MNFYRIAFVLLALSLVVSTGCRKTSKSEIKVGFVTNNTAEFWKIAKVGADAAGEEHDVEVLFREPAQADASGQKEVIDALRNLGIKALAVSVNDPDDQVNQLNRIRKEIPLITFDNDAPNSDRICYIGTNNYEAGKDVGKLVKEVMPKDKQGIVAIFIGQFQPYNAKKRWQGVLDELAGTENATGPIYGNFKLHSLPGPVPYTDNISEKKAKDNADLVLTELEAEIEHGTPVCLIGLWAYNPPAIYNAVKAK